MNADPRRPEKVQRYAAKANSGNGQEDLTPDYMNILGQHQTTGIAAAAEAPEKHVDAKGDPNLQAVDEHAATTNATNVIPTSPQYGVAIISTSAEPAPTEPPPTDPAKELHSTPSRNDRFKVVKIASLEPFKRGRWKCMDYVDEAPPAGAARVPQSAGSIQITGGSYVHSQSLPQQQIQQMLLQGGFANGAQFFANVPQQMVPQGQYFYSQMANVPNQPMGSNPNAAAQFVGNQAFFPAGVVQNSPGFVTQTFPNVQYVPMQQNQSGAFIPTSQFAQNFQQSQSYAGQPAMVNGHHFNAQNEPQLAGSLPAQSVKSVLLNAPPPNVQNHAPAPPNPAPHYQQNAFQPAAPQAHNVAPAPPPQINPAPAPQQPQLDHMYVAVLDNSESASEVRGGGAEPQDDPAKTNPVVNAIDNKIEQAMDLVKSHLMYTVREEVEVLKEKIAELMERIQQLETENNFLRSQIPKAAPQPAAAAAVVANPSPSFVPSSNANAATVTNANQSGAPIAQAQGHSLPAADTINQQ